MNFQKKIVTKTDEIFSRLSSVVRRAELVEPCSAGPHAGDDV